MTQEHENNTQQGMPADTPPPPEATPAENAAGQNELARLKAELEETQHRLLRVSADYQNFVRRSQSNVEAARQEQLMDVAKSLLNVLDHFDRALETDVEKTTARSLQQGVQIVRDELLATLERFAIRVQAIKPGDEFVPGRHEAIMQQDMPGMEPGKVAMVLQKGYELGDIPLRPAKVSVSK